MNGLRSAAMLLTRVRVRPPDRGEPGTAVPWFPVVGAAIGAAVAGVYAGSRLLLPPGVAATLAIAAGVVLTGALHEDGLADVCDALGGWTRERRLEILDDPRQGTFGVIAIVLSLVVRITALASLGPAAAVAALVAAHALSRSAMAVLMLALPPAREGLGSSYAAGATVRRCSIAAIAGLALAAIALRVWAIGAAVACALGVAIVARVARKAFGGQTGDVLGAAQQAGEIAVLVLGAALR
jgi:adenosylcobinamide-GDP ribazoletransferase